MLKLSRIFGITGGILATLPYVYIIACSVIFIITPASGPKGSNGIAAAFALMYTAPAILSSTGLTASFYARKRPLTAGIFMIISGVLNLFIPLAVPLFLRGLFKSTMVLSALLLIFAGVFALLSHKKAPVGKESGNGKPEQAERFPMLRKLSRIISVICAALQILVWAFFSINAFRPDLQNFLTFLAPPLLVSAIGLWGSLLLYRKSMAGTALMFVSGGLGYFIASLYSSFTSYWWLSIAPLLFIATGVLALVSFRKISRNEDSPSPAVK